ncbi:preprotein translocase subunit SecG [Vallitaleaceae bacterium 9-2]|jgi:preprotein translocase subunit SecG
MGTMLVIIKVLYVLVCIALIGVVLFQQGKTAGLSGAIAGAGESYWGKNKARSMEGGLHKLTVILSVVFIFMTMLINILAEIG